MIEHGHDANQCQQQGPIGSSGETPRVNSVRPEASTRFRRRQSSSPWSVPHLLVSTLHQITIPPMMRAHAKRAMELLSPIPHYVDVEEVGWGKEESKRDAGRMQGWNIGVVPNPCSSTIFPCSGQKDEGRRFWHGCSSPKDNWSFSWTTWPVRQLRNMLLRGSVVQKLRRYISWLVSLNSKLLT